MGRATAVAHPNIALVKYWGKADDKRNLPANPSLSMNLAALTTVTTVEFRPDQASDLVTIDGRPAAGQALERVVAHLDRVRALAGSDERAWVASRNDFPAAAGLASSSSAFAALTLAATQAAGLSLDEAGLSRLARLGSGSACRSVPAGIVLWEMEDAHQVAPPEHWDLRDAIAIVTGQAKAVSSHDGHALAPTSPLYAGRLAAVPGWLSAVKAGLARRDLAAMGPAVEADALAMHAVMMTSRPSLLYWLPATVAVLRAVRAWRDGGLEAYFTVDAGPNVHCLCLASAAGEVENRLKAVPGVQQVVVSGPGNGVRSVNQHLF